MRRGSRPHVPHFLAVLTLLRPTASLQVTPGSPCAAQCLDAGQSNAWDANASNTAASDIVCEDDDFASTPNGTKFKDCLSCLQTSTTANGPETDLAWYLYNLRYATDVCVFGYPSSVTNKSVCNTEYACQPLQPALEGLSVDDAELEYQYCMAGNGAFSDKAVSSCVQCLQSSNDTTYLSNFVLALEAGCQQKPATGALLSVSGSLFSKEAINITVSSSNSSSSSPTLSTAAIIGISVGVGGVFLAAAILLLLYWLRQRHYDQEDMIRRAAYGTSRGTSFDGGPGMFHATMDYKHHAPSDSTGAIFSSNADYYNIAKQNVQMQDMEPRPTWAANNHSHSGHLPESDSALPAHPAYIPRALMRPSSRSRSTTPATVTTDRSENRADGADNHRPPPIVAPLPLRSIPDESTDDEYTKATKELEDIVAKPAQRQRQMRQDVRTQPAEPLSAMDEQPAPRQRQPPPQSTLAGFASDGPASIQILPPPPPRGAGRVPGAPPPPPPSTLRDTKRMRRYTPPRISPAKTSPGSRPIPGMEEISISGPLAFPEQQRQDGRAAGGDGHGGGGSGSGGNGADMRPYRDRSTSLTGKRRSSGQRWQEVPIANADSIYD